MLLLTVLKGQGRTSLVTTRHCKFVYLDQLRVIQRDSNDERRRAIPNARLLRVLPREVDAGSLVITISPENYDTTKEWFLVSVFWPSNGVVTGYFQDGFHTRSKLGVY